MGCRSSSELVSVIIPTYYRNELLAETLDSVLDQTHSEIEVVVVDDSGEGYAAPVINTYDEASLVALKTNRGPQQAREIGLDHVSGKYVQFLDDDDKLKPSKIAQQLPLFDEETGVVYCGYELIDPTGETTDEQRLPDQAAEGDVLDYALRTRLDPACTPTMLILRSELEAVRPLTNNHGADIIGLMIELAQRTRFAFVNEALVKVRRGDQHSSYSEFPSVPKGLEDILNTYRDMYSSTDPRNYQYIKNRYHRRMAVGTFQHNWWSASAIVHAAKAAYYAPNEKLNPTVRAIASIAGRPGMALLYRRLLPKILKITKQLRED